MGAIKICTALNPIPETRLLHHADSSLPTMHADDVVSYLFRRWVLHELYALGNVALQAFTRLL